jgi:hypothetical protein
MRYYLPPLLLSASAVLRAMQITGHLSVHRSETFSGPGLTIISYKLSVKTSVFDKFVSGDLP